MLFVCMLQFGGINGLVVRSDEAKGESEGSGEGKRSADGGVETGGLQLRLGSVL